ncbi:LuxR C-terminal-related transcriptional regulator [Brenneria tiliae]|uniref:LuxR C-terminal-related transcriptional regulator n=1 Tax=Brenneria tiliae TaxID=2914984 RepID=UPI002014A583|nr:LuxR C-terminal-related transcriptional regulator [Brenneria tiliae]MCL2898435.1 LuxR C-terminal-related transcriptional regulator [Brenneria tiliae]MCL2903023.1 LuxR C-terminal-related transcriptional regulator [Brenneria tiliae]
MSIQRMAIEERIDRRSTARLIVMSAPSGFGKTNAMLQYYARLQRRGTAIAWLNIDAHDNHGERFLSLLNTALDLTPIPAPSAPGTGRSRQDAVREICRRIESHPGALALFFDDFAALADPAVLAAVQSLVYQLPVNAQMIIGSREPPPFGASRLNANHQLIAIGPRQLQFSLGETVELVRAKYGRRVTPQQIERLHYRTEGWPAALNLALLCAEEAETHSLDPLPLPNAAVADYLAENVLAPLPEALQHFLLRTCVLEKLSAPLCNAVIGHPYGETQLQKIARANLFLFPADAEHCWFRYHRLFAECLRARLERHHPEWAAQAHLAASRWHLAGGNIIAAIEHALAGGNPQYAVTLMAPHLDKIATEANFGTLCRWFDLLPAATFDAFPRLSPPFALSLAWCGRPAEGIKLLDASPHPRAVSVERLAVRAFCLLIKDECACEDKMDMAIWRRQPQRRSTPQWLLILCQAYLLNGRNRFGEAMLIINMARKHFSAAQDAERSAFAEHIQGVCEFTQGRLQEGYRRLRLAEGDLAACGKIFFREKPTLLATMAVMRAELLYEKDELSEADELLTKFFSSAGENFLPDIMVISHITMSRLALTRGDREKAIEMLMRLERIGQRQGLLRLVATYWLERSRIALLEGDVPAAETFMAYFDQQAPWKYFCSFERHGNDIDMPAIGNLRLLIRSGKSAAAPAELRRQIALAESLNRHRRALKLKILLAEALHRNGDVQAGLTTLWHAVAFAAREGFIRTFADEGDGVALLLRALRRQIRDDESELIRFVDRLLAACQPQDARRAITCASRPTEMLTSREVEVLELLSSGFSNAAIAEKLFVARTTVNAHLRNIYSKLETHSRTQTVAVARSQGLLR